MKEAMIGRITSENITELKSNEVFVFGSNLAGRHGKGAAKTALKWGAKYNQASGIQGRTYGIPTKNAAVTKALTVEEIKPFVDDFIEWAKYHSGNTFLVTKIGCGLARFSTKDIADLFERAIYIPNIHLPKSFWEELI